MKEWYDDIDIDDNSYGGVWLQYEVECQVCDMWEPTNNIGLCNDCAGKLERDMIRKRVWAYFFMALWFVK